MFMHKSKLKKLADIEVVIYKKNKKYSGKLIQKFKFKLKSQTLNLYKGGVHEK